MRFIMSFALAFVGFVMANAPAAEARSAWRCIGPAYVCGTTPRKQAAGKRIDRGRYAMRKSYGGTYKRTYKKKYSYSAKKPSYAKPSYKKSSYKKSSYKKQSYKKRSYSGGGSTGIASYYWQPQRVASGGYFNPNALTAAHKTLPFGTRVRVTNQRNGKSVVVTINDRGPFVKGRIIDLSKRAAGVIGMQGAGLAPVRMDVLGRG